MIEISFFTWVVLISGDLIFLLLLGTQTVIIMAPESKLARDLLIGKDEEWRDKTHFKSAFAFAVADWMVIFPILVLLNIGIFWGEVWGYILLLVLGAIAIYFSVFFWFFEKEYTYEINGAIAYYTYFWGSYVYWGIAAAIYALMMIL